MSENSPLLSLAVGDRVVYPNQGVCRVTAVDTKEVAGQRLVFVTLKREEDGAVVMVPEAKVRTIGVRKLASASDINQVFAYLTSDSEKADLDWKQRARTNLDRMSQGGILGLVEVVKGLQVLSELRPLPAKERELYDNARHLLVTELAAAQGISECDAEDSLDLALFPPGKERPKRTAAEFRPLEEGEDGLDLPEDLLGLDAELELPADPDEPKEAEAEAAEGEEEDGGALSDDEPTVTMVKALPLDSDAPAKRKRGRPPKPKPAVAEPPPPPKKRGRPPKPKPAVAAPPPPPKKRGRPPKATTEKAAPAKPTGRKK